MIKKESFYLLIFLNSIIAIVSFYFGTALAIPMLCSIPTCLLANVFLDDKFENMERNKQNIKNCFNLLLIISLSLLVLEILL